MPLVSGSLVVIIVKLLVPIFDCKYFYTSTNNFTIERKDWDEIQSLNITFCKRRDVNAKSRLRIPLSQRKFLLQNVVSIYSRC